MAAAGRFFAISKLAETTLAFFDPRDLLLAQRVSRMFKDVMADSKKLQQALFFVSTTDKPLKRVFRVPPGAMLPLPEPMYVTDDETETQQEVTENPFLHHLVTTSNSDDHIEDHQLKTDEAIFRPEASWRKMLLSSPPVPELRYKATWVSASGTEKNSGDVADEMYNDTGITLGDLIDKVLKLGLGSGGGSYHVTNFSKPGWKKRTTADKGILEEALARMGGGGGTMHAMMYSGPKGA